MRTLTSYAWPLFLCAAGLVLFGCTPPEIETTDEDDPRVDILQWKTDNQKLKTEIDRLTAENQVLRLRYDTLSARSRRLAEELRRLQQDHKKQTELLKVLNDLPAERDRYKLEAERCREQVIKLQMEIRELKKQKP